MVLYIDVENNMLALARTSIWGLSVGSMLDSLKGGVEWWKFGVV